MATLHKDYSKTIGSDLKQGPVYQLATTSGHLKAVLRCTYFKFLEFIKPVLLYHKS